MIAPAYNLKIYSILYNCSKFFFIWDHEYQENKNEERIKNKKSSK